ncbi:MAG: glutamate racemase [Oscillospiraceae bacterium]|nr:glutamate racemase [Oscillospiraceae bacterium]
MDSRPIGIFDSGLGGLTAAAALMALAPEEDLIYFGDSANAPYGTKSREELLHLATANAAFLREFDVKAILVACGTVSSTVIGQVRQRCPVPMFDVVEAPCRAFARSGGRRAAVAATEATIRSGAFSRRLRQLCPDAEICAKSCQSLVSVAEAGHLDCGDPVAEAAVAAEFGPIRDFQPETVLLACTHFPLLQGPIRAFLGPEVALLSVGAEAAAALASYLRENGLLAPEKQREGHRRWFTSGDPAVFSRYAGPFLGRSVKAEYHANGI